MKPVQAAKIKEHNYHSCFESFYQAYYELVVGYLRKKTGSLADAEDIAGKVFLYCLEKWDEFDPEKASQKTWLFMIVRSRWIDYLRRCKPTVALEKLDSLLAGNQDPIEDAIRLEAVRKEVAEGMKKLSEKQREAIILRYFGEYSDPEIAVRIGTSQGNVRVLIHRGLEKLREGFSFTELI